MRLALPLVTASLLFPFHLCAATRTVHLTVAPHIRGSVLIISGTTNLPDHARIDWQARHAEMNTRRDFAVEHMSNSGRVTVRGGRYYARLDLSAWPAGEIEVWVAFEPLAYNNDQPRSVTKLYGEYGQQLTGPNVEVNGQFRNMFRAVAVERVVLKRQTARSPQHARRR